LLQISRGSAAKTENLTALPSAGGSFGPSAGKDKGGGDGSGNGGGGGEDYAWDADDDYDGGGDDEVDLSSFYEQLHPNGLCTKTKAVVIFVSAKTWENLAKKSVV
jgi:hypothetical protein